MVELGTGAHRGLLQHRRGCWFLRVRVARAARGTCGMQVQGTVCGRGTPATLQGSTTHIDKGRERQVTLFPPVSGSLQVADAHLLS